MLLESISHLLTNIFSSPLIRNLDDDFNELPIEGERLLSEYKVFKASFKHLSNEL
jgi:hypothetical protein